MCPLDGLHVEVQDAGLRVGADGGVAGVGEGAGLAVAEAGDIVFVSAEVLLLGGSVQVMLLVWLDFFFGLGSEEGDVLELEGAELLVDNLPYDLIRRHDLSNCPQGGRVVLVKSSDSIVDFLDVVNSLSQARERV